VSTRILMILRALMISAATLATAAPIRLAILTGEGDRAVDDATLAQVEVALTDVKEVTLLERTQIRNILAEQKLSAAGLTDPATAVKLGTLLSVEMFLFAERVKLPQPANAPPGVQSPAGPQAPPICRVQVIETKTGIALAAGMVEEVALGGDGSELKGMIRRAMVTRALPPSERRYIGLLGVRSEDPGNALDGKAQALWTLLSCDLQDCPGMVLLDREHLQRLREEKALTDAEQALKLSTVLIDGGIRRSEVKDKLELTLLLRSLAGGEPERLSLTFAQDDLSAVRKELIAALAQRLRVKTPPLQGGDPATEAKSFLTQARLLTLCGERDATFRATETAYGLWPDRSTRMALVAACSKRAYAWETFYKTPEEAQVRALQYEVRMLTVLCEQYQTDFSPGAPESEDPWAQWRQLGLEKYPGFGIVMREATPEISALQKEAVAMQRELLDIVADAAKRDPKVCGSAYWTALGSAVSRVNSIHFLHPEEQAAGWREFFTLLRKPPAGDDAGFRRFAQNMRTQMSALRFASEPDKAEVRRLFIPIFKEFAGDPDPTIRITAHAGLVYMDPSAADSAETFLQYMAEGMDWKICAEYIRPPDLLPARRAAQLLCEQRPEVAGACCERLLRAWAKQNALYRTVDATGDLESMVRATEKSKGKAEADALCRRVLECLRAGQDRPSWEQKAADKFIAAFETLQAQMAAPSTVAAKPVPAPQAAVAPEPDDPWNQYEARCLGLKLKAPAYAAIVREDRLYCVCCRDLFSGSAGPYMDNGTRNVTVSVHRFPDGGPALRTDALAIPLGKAFTMGQVVWAGFAGDSLYISTGGSLVSFPDNAAPRLLAEADGWSVTGMPISAMAAFGGKLYLAVGERGSGDMLKPKRAFVVFDPVARTVRVVFSNTALEEAQRRDVMITTILADDARKCLWVTLAGDKDSAGIFRYDPATDKLDKLEVANQSDNLDKSAAPYAGTPVQMVALCPGGLLVLTMNQGRKPPISNMLAVLDPQTRKETWLAGQVYGPYLKRRDGDPVFGSSQVGLWPAWYDGTSLITASLSVESGMAGGKGGRLFLHRIEQEPVCNQALAVNPFFQSTPMGLLVLDKAGDGYLIRKKPGGSAETGVKP